MPTFSYTAVDSQGQQQNGMVEANSQAEASAKIKQMGFYPTAVVESAQGIGVSSPSQQHAVTSKGKGKAGKGVPSKVLMVFTRQLATLIDAGLPLVRSLKTLVSQEKQPSLRYTMGNLADTVEGGSTFSEALAQHPKIFNRLYVNMVKAGELGGVLETVLLRLAEFQEKSQRIKGKVIGALTYPVVVLIIAALIMAFLLFFIVPKFESIFNEMLEGKPLPLITELVVTFSRSFVYLIFPPLTPEGSEVPAFISILPNAPIPYLPIFISLLIIGYYFASKTPSGIRLIDRFSLNMPIFGNLLKKTAIARFTRTLGTLVSSGVPILQALNITKETSGNVVVMDAISKVHDAVKEGESMVAPLDASGLFPPMVISMIQVGEETGQLPDMLTKVADVYEEEVDVTVGSLTSLLEPVMIVGLAVIVGTIVIALFYPLITIITTLSSNI
ncbi:MAG: type II secretion system F family protein [Verrucomicrobiota bacterium]